MQIVVNGTLTNYLDINPEAKKTLVVLHGWAHNASLWQTLVGNLPQDWRYVLLDLPGFGQTVFLPNQAGVPEYTQFVVDFMQKLNLKKPWLLGHSFGGQIGMYLAAKFPDKLTHLILVSPAGIRTKTAKQKIKILIYKKFRYLRIFLPSFVLRRIVRLFTSTDYLSASKAHKAVLSTIVNQDLSGLLPDIRVPTDVVWGELDVEIPYAGKQLVEGIKDSKLWVLYGVGHNAHLDKSERLIEVLRKILRNND